MCRAVSEHSDRWCLSSSRFKALLRLVLLQTLHLPIPPTGMGPLLSPAAKAPCGGQTRDGCLLRRSCKRDQALRFFLYPRESKKARCALQSPLPSCPHPSLRLPSLSGLQAALATLLLTRYWLPAGAGSAVCRVRSRSAPPEAAALLRLQPPGPLPARRERTPSSAASPPQRRAGTAAAPSGRRDGAPGRGWREGGNGVAAGEGATAREEVAWGRPRCRKLGWRWGAVGMLRALSAYPNVLPRAPLPGCISPAAPSLGPREAAAPRQGWGLCALWGGAGRGWQHPRRAAREGALKKSCISSPGLVLSQLREVLLKTPAGSFGASPLPERRAFAAVPPSAQHLTVLAPCGAVRRDRRVRHLCFIRLSLSTERGADWATGSRPAPCRSCNPMWGGWNHTAS